MLIDLIYKKRKTRIGRFLHQDINYNHLVNIIPDKRQFRVNDSLGDFIV